MAKDAQSIIIVGVGPFISASLARRLASKGWNIALLSRSAETSSSLAKELKEASPNIRIITKSVDAGDAGALLEKLSEAKKELGQVDVVCYNAGRVGEFATWYLRRPFSS
jgi:short-subunit dehydrogenase